MRLKFLGPLLLLLFVCGPASYAKTNPEALAHKAVSEDATESAVAISELRALGPEGFNTLFRAHVDDINRQIANPLLASSTEWRRLTNALDAVSQQKDSYTSGLYWYTDLGRAKAAARATGKPILSLRLLGKLNEEFSCANSRFFRTILYSNAEVSKALQERFILHWQSVRPAPRVTIDFGDGRKLERTLTGNSIHYILDTDGRPIDALPGLYGPAPFVRSLAQSEEVFKELRTLADRTTAEILPSFYRARLDAINVGWVLDIYKTGGQVPQLRISRSVDGTIQAIEIAALAMTKMQTEATILRSIAATHEALGSVTDEATWKKIALRHMADAQLDARSIGLIRRQTQKALVSEGSKTTPEVALKNLIAKLQMNIALDTVRNDYLLRTKLYAWLIASRSRIDVEALNKKVYAELFLTPASDPWLGLFSPETYMALENGGISR